MQVFDWVATAQRLQALAQTGLTYGQSEYDRERYAEIQSIGHQILAHLSHAPVAQVIRWFPDEVGYQTPKVDIRAVVLCSTGELLMVQEKNDHHRWSLPGGWADVGYTPFEVAAKEVREETGLSVRPVRLLAVFDKKMHPHPPEPWYVYKFFVLCEADAGELLTETMETSGIAWISPGALPTLPLSTDRVTLSQLETVLALATGPARPALCD